MLEILKRIKLLEDKLYAQRIWLERVGFYDLSQETKNDIDLLEILKLIAKELAD